LEAKDGTLSHYLRGWRLPDLLKAGDAESLLVPSCSPVIMDWANLEAGVLVRAGPTIADVGRQLSGSMLLQS
jgi:hypothetical protein